MLDVAFPPQSGFYMEVCDFACVDIGFELLQTFVDVIFEHLQTHDAESLRNTATN